MIVRVYPCLLLPDVVVPRAPYKNREELLSNSFKFYYSVDRGDLIDVSRNDFQLTNFSHIQYCFAA